MMGIVKCLFIAFLICDAAQFRHISRRGRNATKAVTANTSIAVSNSSLKNATVSLANQTLKNATVALANQTAMATPRPGKLRICNAYSAGTLTATVGYPEPRYRSSAPAAYRDCVQMVGNFKAGDTVEIYFGKTNVDIVGKKTAVYLPYPPYADHATILLVVYGTKGGEGFDIKMQYFRSLKYPQVAAIDCVPQMKPAKLTLEHLDPKAPTESVAFDKVGPIDRGLTKVLLDGKPATGGQFNAAWTEEYAIMRIGASEVAIYPPLSSLGSQGHSIAITSIVMAVVLPFMI